MDREVTGVWVLHSEEGELHNAVDGRTIPLKPAPKRATKDRDNPQDN